MVELQLSRSIRPLNTTGLKLSRPAVDTAEGAEFNSHGRKAVDPNVGLHEARRAGTIFARIENWFNAAPLALNTSYFGLSTASRPWLLNDGPADLTLHLSGTLNQRNQSGI